MKNGIFTGMTEQEIISILETQTPKELAKIYKCSEHTICNYKCKYDVRKKTIFSEFTDDELIKILSDNSAIELAIKYNCTKDIIYYYRKKYGIVIARESTADSLCWKCQNSCCRCSWSKSFKPVQGWTATPTVIQGKLKTDIIHSYFVTDCPLFKRDKPRRKKSEYDDEPYEPCKKCKLNISFESEETT